MVNADPVLISKASLDAKGRIVIDSQIRETVGLVEGSELSVRLVRSDVGWLIVLQEEAKAK